MMKGRGYCSNCKKEVDVSYCKYWWRDDSPATDEPFHKTCCVCGGSNVEFLVGPLAPNIPVMMEKLEAVWHDLNKHCQYSFAQVLALILPSSLGDVAFSDEEFNTALDEVLATWDNAE